ncbi:hypothetical protein D3C81_1859540 [compost metagenome]
MQGIAGGDVGRAEVGADHAFRRRRFFDFSDDAGLAGGDVLAQACFKAAQAGAQCAVAFHVAAQAGQAAAGFGLGHFIGFYGQDFIEYVGHDGRYSIKEGGGLTLAPGCPAAASPARIGRVSPARRPS